MSPRYACAAHAFNARGMGTHGRMDAWTGNPSTLQVRWWAIPDGVNPRCVGAAHAFNARGMGMHARVDGKPVHPTSRVVGYTRRREPTLRWRHPRIQRTRDGDACTRGRETRPPYNAAVGWSAIPNGVKPCCADAAHALPNAESGRKKTRARGFLWSVGISEYCPRRPNLAWWNLGRCRWCRRCGRCSWCRRPVCSASARRQGWRRRWCCRCRRPA